jgi:hypothetical protein
VSDGERDEGEKSGDESETHGGGDEVVRGRGAKLLRTLISFALHQVATRRSFESDVGKKVIRASGSREMAIDRRRF